MIESSGLESVLKLNRVVFLSFLPCLICTHVYFGRKSRWWRPQTVFVVLPCDIYPGFVQQVIQDVSLALFTAVPLSGRFLVHSFHRWTVAIASYVRN